MHTENLDLNLLGVLDALLKEGSVTRAAQGLGLTQSATSHALGRLREFFEDPLFVKVGSRMEPTAKALGMRQAVAEVMGTVRGQILAQQRFEPRREQRLFTLCMTDMAELVFLPALLQRLKNEAPGCTLRTLQVPLEQVEGLLASGEADLVVGSFRSAPDGLYQQRLFQHSFVTIASVRNQRIGDRLSLEQFEASPHIVVSLTGRVAESYDKPLETQGVRRTIAVVTPHFLMVPHLIDQHPELLATVPRKLAEVFSGWSILRMFEPPLPMPQLPLNQHWHPRFHHDPAVMWLRETIKRTFESYPVLVTSDEG